MISGSVFVGLLLELALVSGTMNNCPDTHRQEYYSEPCNIRNLTVKSTSGPEKVELASETKCNESVPVSLLSSQPEVYLSFSSHLTQNSVNLNSTFILLAFDATSHQLLWAASNITAFAYPIGKMIFPKSVLKAYEPANINPSKPVHDVVFMVYAKQPDDHNDAVTVTPSEIEKFNLQSWLFRQFTSGSKLCGPIAATRLSVYSDAGRDVQPAQQNPIPTSETPFSHSQTHPQPSTPPTPRHPQQQPHNHPLHSQTSPSYPQTTLSYPQTTPSYFQTTPGYPQTTPANPQQQHHSSTPHPQPSNSTQPTTHDQVLYTTLPPTEIPSNTSTHFISSPQLQSSPTTLNNSESYSERSKAKNRNSGVNIKSNFPAIVFILFSIFKIN